VNKSVVFAGTGIKALSHITKEVEAAIQQADMVAYLVNEPVTEKWIEEQAKKHFSFEKLYFSRTNRTDAYKLIKDEIIALSNSYNALCVVIYGHPSLYSNSAIQSGNELGKQGVNVVFLPGISADGCMFADLRVDPGVYGCISMDASEYLYYEKVLDKSCHVVFWQIGLTGMSGPPGQDINHTALQLLSEKLITLYGKNHKAILYEASLYPHVKPRINEIKISELATSSLSPITTLYIPPLEIAVPREKISD